MKLKIQKFSFIFFSGNWNVTGKANPAKLIWKYFSAKWSTMFLYTACQYAYVYSDVSFDIWAAF